MEWINTVTGRVRAEELGKTLVHEHLLIGFPGWFMDALAPRFKRAEALSRAVDKLQEKVTGAIIMSGAPTMPACSSRISVIITVAENDIGPAADQAAIPMGHGCGAATMNMLGNNEQRLWPDCDPGYVHSTYRMLGKGHIDSMDAEVVKSIVDLIVKARP